MKHLILLQPHSHAVAIINSNLFYGKTGVWTKVMTCRAAYCEILHNSERLPECHLNLRRVDVPDAFSAGRKTSFGRKLEFPGGRTRSFNHSQFDVLIHLRPRGRYAAL